MQLYIRVLYVCLALSLSRKLPEEVRRRCLEVPTASAARLGRGSGKDWGWGCWGIWPRSPLRVLTCRARTILGPLRNSSKIRCPPKTVLGRFWRALTFPTGSRNRTFEAKLGPRPPKIVKNIVFDQTRKIPRKSRPESMLLWWLRTTFSIGKQIVS